tara:strand:+ start:594 stop:797 length:204 start_codon:yes stop_codon:yes gene_type:complete
MSKILNKLIDSDDRFCKQLRYDKDAYGYHVHLKPEYHVNECHTIWGETIKQILSQLKYIELTTWEYE